MARKMSAKRDHAMDRKAGIKQGSAADNRLDKARDVRDSAVRRTARKGK